MHKIIIPILLFVFIAGMAKGVSDTLQFHYGTSVFSSFQNEQWWNPEVSWKNKYRDYDNGDNREAYLLSRSLLVWRTDAWHLAQTIETGAWVLAVLFAIRLGYWRRITQSREGGEGGWFGGMHVARFFCASILVFYIGFLALYGWLLLS
ncbi:hypothetical protein BK004_00500 [bacterium CG10_46_32]|nr:MAG: hypothetical protein BK004_00500 [bacterium CG10_46_32]PIR56507.1 MAG: hypothetical protein COU73_00495 [Parcubacteria group bacterium CG10_big_fil_rev_8_21_14_0_10_46_32]